MELDNDASKQEIENLKKIVGNNNKLLKKIDKRMKYAAIAGYVRLVIYIGLLVGAFALLRPYYEKGVEVYENISRNTEKVAEFQDKATINFGEIIDFFRAPSSEENINQDSLD